MRRTNGMRFVGGLHEVGYKHWIRHDFSTHSQEGVPSAKGRDDQPTTHHHRSPRCAFATSVLGLQGNAQTQRRPQV